MHEPDEDCIELELAEDRPTPGSSAADLSRSVQSFGIVVVAAAALILAVRIFVQPSADRQLLQEQRAIAAALQKVIHQQHDEYLRLQHELHKQKQINAQLERTMNAMEQWRSRGSQDLENGHVHPSGNMPAGAGGRRKAVVGFVPASIVEREASRFRSEEYRALPLAAKLREPFSFSRTDELDNVMKIIEDRCAIRIEYDFPALNREGIAKSRQVELHGINTTLGALLADAARQANAQPADSLSDPGQVFVLAISADERRLIFTTRDRVVKHGTLTEMFVAAAAR